MTICECILMITASIACLSFAWNQYKESKAWIENEESDEADWWKKGK